MIPILYSFYDVMEYALGARGLLPNCINITEKNAID
jgi:hypothetical protein